MSYLILNRGGAAAQPERRAAFTEALMPDPVSIEWPKIVAAAAAGGLIGFLFSRLQDVINRRRRFRAVAGTLLAELHRIRREIGEPEIIVHDFEGFGGARDTPAIHPWVEKIITEASDLNVEIVGGFLDLDRELHNYRFMFLALRKARTEVYELDKQLEQSSTEGDVLETTTAQRAQAEEEFQTLQGMTAEIRRDAWKTMAHLQSLLASYARRVA